MSMFINCSLLKIDFKLITVTCDKERIVGRGKNREGGNMVILSTSTSTQTRNRAISQGKLRKITKCLLTRFS